MTNRELSVVVAPPTDWRVTLMVGGIALADYVFVRFFLGPEGALAFVLVAIVTLPLAAYAMGTRIAVVGEELQVRPHGYLGRLERYPLREVGSIRSGFVGGELVLEFKARDRVVRLGPWFGVVRRRLLQKVQAVTVALASRCDGQSPGNLVG